MNAIDWLDLIIRETDQLIITSRIKPQQDADDAFSFDESSEVIAWHAECRAHGTKIEVDQDAARRLNSTGFCQQCRTHKPAVKRELSPLANMLRQTLLHQRLEQSMDDFLESLDFDGENDTARDDRLNNNDSQAPY